KVVVSRAVATNTGGGPVGGNGCIYSLGAPSKQANFNKAGFGSTGTNYIIGPACGVVDNGNFVANGNVSVKMGSIGVGGQVNLPNNSTPNCSDPQPAGVCPTPVVGMPYSGDPFSNKYPIPSPPAAGTVTTSVVGGVTIKTYSPGSYSGITINSGDHVIFSPGLYYITGSFRINAQAYVCGGGTASFVAPIPNPFCTEISGGGVTFFIT